MVAETSLEAAALVERIHESVAGAITPGSTVLVAGGDNLLRGALNGRDVVGFPQARNGMEGVDDPSNSLAAIAELTVLSLYGASFLLIPRPQLWWLDYYVDLRRHLDRHYRLVVERPDTCYLYDLLQPLSEGETVIQVLDAAIDEIQRCSGRPVAILDWDTGLDLRDRLPHRTIFSPFGTVNVLPYLDHTIDVVVIPNLSSRLQEARRVVSGAIITLAPVRTSGGPSQVESADLAIDIDWRHETSEVPPRAQSIIAVLSNNEMQAKAQVRAITDALRPGYEDDVILAVYEYSSTAEVLPWCDERMTIVEVSPRDDVLTQFQQAARTARHEIVLCLAPGVIPLRDGLFTLAATLEFRAHAGAVGGKLLDTHGMLWEAGGTTRSDGSFLRLGEGCDADDPEFNYLRAVDRVSSGFLATWRSRLLDAVPNFSHMIGYSEYLSAQGLEVLYQPGAVAVALGSE